MRELRRIAREDVIAGLISLVAWIAVAACWLFVAVKGLLAAATRFRLELAKLTGGRPSAVACYQDSPTSDEAPASPCSIGAEALVGPELRTSLVASDHPPHQRAE